MDENKEKKDPRQLNAFEKLYEHFRGIPIRYIDRFIAVCIAALVLVVIIGMLKGRGLL